MAKRQADMRSQTQGNGTATFADVLLAQAFDALAETDPVHLRAALVRLAATVVGRVEALDERASESVPASPAPAVAGPTWLEVQS